MLSYMRDVALCCAALIATAILFLLSGVSVVKGQPADEPEAPAARPSATPRTVSAAMVPGYPVPEGRFLPFINPCVFENPDFKASPAVGVVGDQIGWYGLGFQAGSPVSIRLYSMLNEDLVAQQSVIADGWCSTMGAFPTRAPDAYFLVLSGINTKGETTQLVEAVRIVMDLRTPTPAPTPRPAPPAPSALRATAVSASIVRLDWMHNSGSETGYVIDVDGGFEHFRTSAFASSTTLNIGSLRPATSYCFAIAAVSEVGHSQPATTCAATRSQ